MDHDTHKDRRPASETWLQTAAGDAFDLLAPSARKILLADIAQSLSRLARFNGYTTRMWSVAAHSMLVSRIVYPDDPETRLYALLHDAPEAYMGDLTSPMKAAVAAIDPRFAGAWSVIEHAIAQQIHIAFGLDPDMPAETAAVVKLADLQALELERRWFFADPPPRPWRVGGQPLPEPPDVPCPPERAPSIEAGLFIEAAQRLVNQRHGLA